MKIVVAGATGTLGRKIVDAIDTAGHIAVPISRDSGVDLITGAGLESVMTGAAAVVDASSTSIARSKQAVAFFSTVTRNLLTAEKAAAVDHHVAISIIGAAAVNANYYAGKAAQEKILMTEGAGRCSLLRTTQFHEFVHQLIRAGKIGPVQLVPRMLSQPIAASEVATELVSVATRAPRGLLPDLAGPRQEWWPDLVRSYLATGPRRPMIDIAIPGRWGRAMRDGTLLPAVGTRLGSQTFDQWLATQDVASGMRDD